MARLPTFECCFSTLGLALLLLSAVPVAIVGQAGEPIYLSGLDLPRVPSAVVNGSGTSSDPYLLRGLAIDARGGEYGIWIEDSDAFVVIQACEISGCLSPSALGGIYLRNCTHVVVEDCVIRNNRVGIRVDRSTDVTVRSNIIAGNYYGIDLGFFSAGNVVYANRFDNCENARAEAANQWSSLGQGNCWSDATSTKPYVISPANVDSHACALGECPSPVDRTRPVIGDVARFTFECCASPLPRIPDVFATDNMDGRIRADIDVREVDFGQPGVYPVTVTACDEAGNCAEVIISASVLDTLPPEIILTGAGDVTVECGQGLKESELGASAIDQCDRAPRLSVDSSQLDPACPGTYTVFYRAVDAAKNASEAVRTVRVVDTTPPRVVVEGEEPLYLESDFSVPDLKSGIRAVDACSGELPPESIEVEYSADDLRSKGLAIASYRARDSWGNVSEPVSRTLILGPLCPDGLSDPALGEVSIACDVGGNELTISASLSDSVEADALHFLYVAELIQRLLQEVNAAPSLAIRVVVDTQGQRFVDFRMQAADRAVAGQKPGLLEFLRASLYREEGVWEGCEACRPPQDVDQARRRVMAAVSYVVPQAESAIVRVYPRGMSFPVQFHVEILYYLPIEARPSDYPGIADAAEQLAELVDILLGGTQGLIVSVFGNYHGVLYRGSLHPALGDEIAWSVEYVNPILEAEWP